MIKVDVISGFLGAGKTTLIKKIYEKAFLTEKVALIENEFGEIGIDGAFLKESGIEIKEINSGCICCSLVGNFETSLKELIDKYSPNRIVIEPSGVGKLSEVVNAISNVEEDLKVNILCAVVDGGKCKMYSKNFGEFYLDQIIEANVIVLSKTDKLTEQKIIDACEFIKQYNPTATIITTPIKELDGTFLLENLENNVSLVELVVGDLMKKHKGEHHHHHHHDEHCNCEHDHEHEHDHDEHCCCGHDHEHDHEHEHDHDEHCCCGHDHEHEHGEHCCCGHHHDADEVFDSWGVETPISYSKCELESVLKELALNNVGIILRSKGIVKASDNEKWYYFDFVSGDYEIRIGEPDVIGKLCLIGSNLDKQKISELFKIRG